MKILLDYKIISSIKHSHDNLKKIHKSQKIQHNDENNNNFVGEKISNVRNPSEIFLSISRLECLLNFKNI